MTLAACERFCAATSQERNRKNGNKQTIKKKKKHKLEKEKEARRSQAGWFVPPPHGEVKNGHALSERETDRGRGGRLPEDGGVVFECLNRAGAPTADQRQRSGWALSGIKSR